MTSYYHAGMEHIRAQSARYGSAPTRERDSDQLSPVARAAWYVEDAFSGNFEEDMDARTNAQRDAYVRYESLVHPERLVCVVALAHLYIVGASAGKPPEAGTAPLELFNNLFNPVAVSERGIDVYVELGSYRNFAAEEWTHELVWDLFVGRWIWLEGRRREIFTCHSVLLTNLIGPPGLLLHALTVQLYAFFRSDDPTARWADPEALRTELEGQQRASDGGG